ncbi:hypothetical protein [Neorhizobium galegae]|uniref:hypothetical protein n=1 Tax=Neorhizobium galegae TaxID=399 RepID=UPI0006216891|nr:hypothetical protein [Neorhizobium galegae]CDZ25679.1 Hypothetical protein NGAL_HAMBI490_05130 [Neorhizobium galegae bv. officinalis]KAA9387468.1 hypothetical protein F4V88_13865 [Neorhizobium galegae]KAB1114602.1 hypothetical protein F4V89_09465 [Neorhizobium galegae]MCM2499288.1 hypothetical protein [Neorhizobium galegae]MCQ1772604.1 hypothetical protein [Neorhizobium galegae]
MPLDENVLFQEWRSLLGDPKSVFDWPTWEFLQVVYDNRDKGIPSLKSKSAQRIQLLVQLADKHDIALEGVRVRFCAWADRPMEDITVTFEVLHAERWTCISRIDFHPYGPHSNRYWRKFGLAADVNGSHIHSYDDNVRLGTDAFTALGNLPNASPLDEEPGSFREICQVVGRSFNIKECDNLPMPEWNGSLL